jgi:Zn-dependent peptidase ImmA (M78 family)
MGDWVVVCGCIWSLTVPSISVEIAPSVLEWIGNAAFFEGVDKSLLSHFYKWKNDEAQPTYAQIESLSKKIHIPLGYFFLKTPPKEDLPMLEFRTLNSTTLPKPSRDLIDTYYQTAAIQNWMRDYLLDQGNERLPFVSLCSHEKKPEIIAASIRNAIGLDKDWYTQSQDSKVSFDKLRELIESNGILILQNGVVGQNNYRKLSITEFRAFTLIDEYAPLIFINNNDTTGGKLFSLLHEAVHIWLGLYSFYNEDSGLSFNVSPQETLCNAAAAELLVPNAFFIDKWNGTHKPALKDKITYIAKHFKCGEITIARRALDNNYIVQSQYEEIAADVITGVNTSNKKSGGGDYYKTIISRLGSRLILAIDNSVKEGKTPYTEAFALTGTNHATFTNLVTKIRGQE